MGLDMYLKASKKMPRAVATLIMKSAPDDFRYGNDWVKIKTKIVTLVAEAAYWRKANAVHGWFVEEVQGGNDDCEYYAVTEEQLKALRDDCQAVLDGADPANHNLVPRRGFFFGSTNVDEGYKDDLRDTITMIDRTLKNYSGWTYEYFSSW